MELLVSLDSEVRAPVPRAFANIGIGTLAAKKVRPPPGGEAAAREPGLGTGRGGDVTGVA